MMVPTASTTLSGMGDCLMYDDSGNCLLGDPSSSSGSSGSIDLCASNPQLCGQGSMANQPSYFPSSATPVTSTGMTAGQLALLNTIAQGGITLGKELAITPGTTVSPSGAVSQQNPGFPIGTAGLTGQLSTSGGSMMLLLGAGLLAVLFMSRK